MELLLFTCMSFAVYIVVRSVTDMLDRSSSMPEPDFSSHVVDVQTGDSDNNQLGEVR